MQCMQPGSNILKVSLQKELQEHYGIKREPIAILPNLLVIQFTTKEISLRHGKDLPQLLAKMAKKF